MYICMQNHNDDTIKTSDRSLEKYTSHFIERVWKGYSRFYCKRELGTEQTCDILTPTLMAITAFLSRSPGLLNRGPLCVLVLSTTPFLRLTDFLSSTGLYNNFDAHSSSCERHNFNPSHGQGYILIFLDWIRLLFTLVHFLFWQLCRDRRSICNIRI